MIHHKVGIRDIFRNEKNNPAVGTPERFPILQFGTRRVVCFETVELDVIVAPLAVNACEETMFTVAIMKTWI